MNTFSALLLFLIVPVLLPGQKHDHNWIMGGPGYGPPDGSVHLDFNASPVSVTENEAQTLNYNFSSSNISGPEGGLLLYSNGVAVADASGHIIPGGDSLSPGIQNDWYYEAGARCINCAFFLPSPGMDSSYLFFNIATDSLMFVNNDLHAWNTLYVSVIKKNGPQQGWAVTEKDVPVLSGIFSSMAAVRHGNGRDWWAVFQEKNGKAFHVALVAPDGAHLTGAQTVGDIVPVAHPQNENQYVFSPDGSKLAFGSKFTGIHVLQFDRCGGILGPLSYYPFESIEPFAWHDFGYGVPMAFSPNGRFLYFATATAVVQLDLEDPAMDTVAVHDGYFDPQSGPTYFWLMQLAPDGKIYIGVNGSKMSYIEHPDLKGESCMVVQRGLDVHFHTGGGMPYFPNYRLGPLDGSPCDTLGLDNLPLANFRCEVADSGDIFTIVFTDLSSYEPATWSWDFGGTGMSGDTSPVHTFPGNGVYQVCLTVGNQYDSDTFCKEVVIGTTGTKGTAAGNGLIGVFPNPSNQKIHVTLADAGGGAAFAVTDVLGRPVANVRLGKGETKVELDVQDWPASIYFLQYFEDGEVRAVERFVVTK